MCGMFCLFREIRLSISDDDAKRTCIRFDSIRFHVVCTCNNNTHQELTRYRRERKRKKKRKEKKRIKEKLIFYNRCSNLGLKPTIWIIRLTGSSSSSAAPWKKLRDRKRIGRNYRLLLDSRTQRI